jgi:hypothetical protein
MPYYISIQYSAIQAAILRHDRLWSMAGTSLLMAELNEKIFPEYANLGQTVVCGGKFTARFDDKEVAETARRDIITALVTTFPMLEFQIASEAIKGGSLQDTELRDNLIKPLGVQKMELRGSGVSFNPHVQRCAECGEYPAEGRFAIKKKTVCSYCHEANKKCWDLRKFSAFLERSTALVQGHEHSGCVGLRIAFVGPGQKAKNRLCM